MSVKDFFSKIGFAFACVFAFLVGLFWRKVLHNDGKRTDGNSSTYRPDDDESRRADGLREEAGESAQSIHDIIERVKAREREIEKQG